MKLVKFKDGTFGIRYGILFHLYQDFNSKEYRWPANHKHFHDCRTNEADARALFDLLTDKGTPIK